MIDVDKINNVLENLGVFGSIFNILSSDYPQALLEDNLNQFNSELRKRNMDDTDIDFIKFCKRNLKINFSKDKLFSMDKKCCINL